MGKLPKEEVEPHVRSAIDGLLVAIKCPDGMMRMGQKSTFSMRHIVTLHDQAIGKFGRGTMYSAWELVLERVSDPNGLFVVNA